MTQMIAEIQDSKYFKPGCAVGVVTGAAIIAIAQRCQAHWAKQACRAAGSTLLVSSAIAPFACQVKVPASTDRCEILNCTMAEFIEKHRPVMEIPLERLASIQRIEKLELEVDELVIHGTNPTTVINCMIRRCALNVDLMMMRLSLQFKDEPDPRKAIAEHWGHQVENKSRESINGDYNVYFWLSTVYRHARQTNQDAFFQEGTEQYAWRQLYNDWCEVVAPMLDRICFSSGLSDGRYRRWSNPDTEQGPFALSPDTQPT